MRNLHFVGPLILVLGFLVLFAAVHKAGGTFGSQCRRAGFQEADYFKCVEWLSEGKSWEDWANE